MSLASLFFILNDSASESEAEDILTLLSLLKIRRSMRRGHYFTRAALPSASVSAWAKLLRSEDEYGFIDTMGFDCSTFRNIHSFFAPFLEAGKQGSGSIPSQNSFGVLALTLFWLNSSMKQKTLCRLFGIWPKVYLLCFIVFH
eukprot:GCRY01005173.1.p2 GENE.GCRY01005173.1~~GCRY01005173.1.p2  ORF type:complete len:143 (+),score=11.46 GCRY01005173.1:193-621(+)